MRPGDISRSRALAWARKHPWQAKTVAAMFADAVDAEVCAANPFANRRQQQSRERRFISPLTEAEVNTLADIAYRDPRAGGQGLDALRRLGGVEARRDILVAATDLNFASATVKIRRVKKRGGVHPIDTVVLPKMAADAIKAMPAIPITGPVFRTNQGAPMVKGALHYYWPPIRSTFRVARAGKPNLPNINLT